MTQHEFEYWQAVTESSAHKWVEDRVTRLNGNGATDIKWVPGASR